MGSEEVKLTCINSPPEEVSYIEKRREALFWFHWEMGDVPEYWYMDENVHVEREKVTNAK